jgi:hypothetical protein
MDLRTALHVLDMWYYNMFTPIMEALNISETSVCFCQAARRNIPEDSLYVKGELIVPFCYTGTDICDLINEEVCEIFHFKTVFLDWQV